MQLFVDTGASYCMIRELLAQANLELFDRHFLHRGGSLVCPALVSIDGIRRLFGVHNQVAPQARMSCQFMGISLGQADSSGAFSTLSPERGRGAEALTDYTSTGGAYM